MAKRIVGRHITRPGRAVDDEDITFPVAKDLLKVPGAPRREDEITFYSREYPLESFAVAETASAEWAGQVRDEFSPETSELYRKFQSEMEPLVEWIKSTGDLAPTGTSTGDDVTDSIRGMARQLGYGEEDCRPAYHTTRKNGRRQGHHSPCG